MGISAQNDLDLRLILAIVAESWSRTSGLHGGRQILRGAWGGADFAAHTTFRNAGSGDPVPSSYVTAREW